MNKQTNKQTKYMISNYGLFRYQTKELIADQTLSTVLMQLSIYRLVSTSLYNNIFIIKTGVWCNLAACLLHICFHGVCALFLPKGILGISSCFDGICAMFTFGVLCVMFTFGVLCVMFSFGVLCVMFSFGVLCAMLLLV